MDPWVIWLIAAVGLAVGEIFTLSFFLAPFAVGALVGALVSAVGGGDVLALAAFLIVSVVSLVALRPIARSHMKQPAQLRTGTAALIGKTAVVQERVDGHGGTVKLEGDIWSARAYVEDEVYEPGTKVSVTQIKGATALVSD